MKGAFSTAEQQGRETPLTRFLSSKMAAVEEGATPDFYETLSQEDRAKYFYDLMVTAREAHATGDDAGVTELYAQMKKILNQDPASAQYFEQAFKQARLETKKVERSPMFQLVVGLTSEIRSLNEEYASLKQRIFTEDIKGVASVKVAEGKIADLSRKIVQKQRERAELVSLERKIDQDVLQTDGTMKSESRPMEHTKENTDIAALEEYATLKRYQGEAEKGFAWLPSRAEIHKKILAALKNGRFPLLVGEPGTGKSEQADAVGRLLTGEVCVKVSCTSSTGEQDLIVDAEAEGTQFYKKYGGATRAFTGHTTSVEEQECAHGRILRLDEFLKINFGKTFGLIKELGQKKPGDRMHEKVDFPVLPGSTIIGTTNPAGTRHGLEKLSPALEREFAEISVDYLSMSPEEPELYEFMLATLMDDKGYISLPKGEIAPKYQDVSLASDERTLDGRKILKREELVVDSAHGEHGALYRLAFAIRAIQDSYIAGNPNERAEYESKLLRLDSTSKNVSDQGSEAIILESATLTLKEITSWMRGFSHRFDDTNEDMHVETFSEWLAYKVGVFISQSPEKDRENLSAIFRHFGILEPQTKRYDKKPLTHLEIGYLSPRVPRPMVVEEKILEIPDVPAGEMERPKDVTTLVETMRVVLDTGDTVNVRKQAYTYREGTLSGLPDMLFGERFTLDGKIFVYAGVIEDKEHNGSIVAHEEGEVDLYMVIVPESMQEGVNAYFFENLQGSLKEYQQDIEEECGAGYLNEPVGV